MCLRHLDGSSGRIIGNVDKTSEWHKHNNNKGRILSARGRTAKDDASSWQKLKATSNQKPTSPPRPPNRSCSAHGDLSRQASRNLWSSCAVELLCAWTNTWACATSGTDRNSGRFWKSTTSSSPSEGRNNRACCRAAPISRSAVPGVVAGWYQRFQCSMPGCKW